MPGSAPSSRHTIVVYEFVTGGGLAEQDLPPTLASEGAAMRRALATEFSALADTQLIMPLDHRLTPENGPWQVVPIGPGQELATLCELADSADSILIIAPETEGILTERLALIQGKAAWSLGSTPGAAAQASDKWRLSGHLERNGIRTPRCRLLVPDHGLPGLSEWRYPAVIKPLDGAGALRTFFVPEPAQCPPQALLNRPALLQEFQAGQVMSASFLVDRWGEPHLLAVGSQRIAIRDGVFTYEGGRVPDGRPAMAQAAAATVRIIPGLRGWVGVDFIWDPDQGEASILDVNPRVTTSCVGLLRLLPRGRLGRAWLSCCGRQPEAAGPMIGDLSTHEAVDFEAGSDKVRARGTP